MCPNDYPPVESVTAGFELGTFCLLANQLNLTCDKCFHRCVIWIKTSFINKNYGVISVPNDCSPGTVGSVDVPMFCWCWICWRSLRRWSAVWWPRLCDARRSTKYGYNLLQSNYIIKYDCNISVLQSNYMYISKHGCNIPKWQSHYITKHDCNISIIRPSCCIPLITIKLQVLEISIQHFKADL